MVVAGTDAAATVLPHLARQLIALHSLRADVAAQVETLVQAHPLYQVLTSMPGIGVPAAAVFLAETLGKTSRHRRPPGLLPRPGTGDQEIGLIDPRRACHPRRQQAAHARRVPVRLRLPALRPRQPGLLPAQTRSGKASQPGRPRPGPPPHPDPARHDPGWSPLRSTTISTPTRSRLTHHIGAPPGSRRPPARRARREGDRRRPLRRASDHVRRRGGSRVPLAHAPPSSRLCNPFARTASVDALRALGSPHANLSAAQSGTQQGPSRTAWVGTSTSVVVGF